MLSSIRLSTFVVALLAAVGVHSHSWIDDLQVVGGSSPTGKKGYIRNYDGHVDGTASYRINGPDEFAVFDRQRTPKTYPKPEYPMLEARPGDYVMGTYTENGHISKDNPARPGNTWWFLLDPSINTANLKMSTVVSWTRNQPPANEARILSGPIPYDDGVCIEANDSELAKARLAVGGGGPCKSTFKIPEDTKTDTITVLWVWDFSGKFNGSGFEWYTSVADIKISIGNGSVTAKSIEGTTPDAVKSDPKRLKRRMVASAKFRRHLGGW